MHRDYKAGAYKRIDTPDAQVKASWTYAPGSKLTLVYNRSINEVTASGAGGAIVDDVKLGVSHAFSDDLSGKAEGRFKHAAYRGGSGGDDGSARADDYYALALGVKYALTGRTALAMDYALGRNNSNASDSDYTQNVIMLGVKAGM